MRFSSAYFASNYDIAMSQITQKGQWNVRRRIAVSEAFEKEVLIK